MDKVNHEIYMSKLISMGKKKRADFSKDEELVMQPFNYLRNEPLKFVQRFVEAANYWYRLPAEKYNIVFEIIDYLADHAKLIDEIADDTKESRGKTSTHIVYGVPRTLMCAQYIGFKVLEKLVALNNSKVLELYIEFGKNFHAGQSLDAIYRDGPCPNFDDYVHTITGKSFSYVLFISQLLMSMSDNKKEYREILMLFSLFLQMHNDCQNIFSSEDENKYSAFADDLGEGNYSFPLIYAIDTLKNQEVAEILRQRPDDFETRRRCVNILREIGVEKFCMQMMEDLIERIKTEMAKTDENPLIIKYIDDAMKSFQEIWS